MLLLFFSCSSFPLLFLLLLLLLPPCSCCRSHRDSQPLHSSHSRSSEQSALSYWLERRALRSAHFTAGRRRARTCSRSKGALETAIDLTLNILFPKDTVVVMPLQSGKFEVFFTHVFFSFFKNIFLTGSALFSWFIAVGSQSFVCILSFMQNWIFFSKIVNVSDIFGLALLFV